jgi:hypothetical protein
MVEKHIKNLLYNHDCVIIPEFGGLITRYVPARINPVKHSLVPPSKKIAFNEKLILNDGLLISTIAFANSITNEEAKQLVTAFVHDARTRLNGENRFELADIGVFRYNTERRLEFEYTESENLLEASFGLPELIARPVRHEEPAVLRTLIKERQVAAPAQVKQPLRSRLKRAYNVAAGLALTGLVGAGLYMLSLQTDYTISSLSPISFAGADTKGTPLDESAAVAYETVTPATGSSFDTPAATAAEDDLYAASSDGSGMEGQYVAEENVIEEVIAEQPTPEPVMASTKVSGKDGRFYIITGGYSRMNNAEFSRQEIAEHGHQAKVLEPGRGSRLFKVAVADFATAEEAQAAMNTYRQSFGETIWVFNN